jgi:phage tail-like protein
MALSKDEIAAAYPLPAYDSRVTVEGTGMNSSEVSGILIEHESLTYRHGLSYWEGESIRTFRIGKYVRVTLTKCVSHRANPVHEWLNEAGDKRRSIEVSLCDAAGDPVVTWRIAKAVPVKLDAPGFDPTENGVAIESLEIMAAGICVEHH